MKYSGKQEFLRNGKKTKLIRDTGGQTNKKRAAFRSSVSAIQKNT